MRSVAHLFMDATTPVNAIPPDPCGFWDVSDELGLEKSLGDRFDTFDIIWSDIDWHLDLHARYEGWEDLRTRDDARAFEENWWPLPR